MKRYKVMEFGKLICIVDTHNRNLMLRDEANKLISFSSKEAANDFCDILEDEVREGYVATIDNDMLKKCIEGVQVCQ